MLKAIVVLQALALVALLFITAEVLQINEASGAVWRLTAGISGLFAGGMVKCHPAD